MARILHANLNQPRRDSGIPHESDSGAFGISRTKLTRMVERFFSMYDSLDLGNLSWAYWHARTVPPYIVPAHFGSAIEALQRSYSKMNPRKIRTKKLADAQWKQLVEALNAVVEKASISEEDKAAVVDKIKSNANSAPKRDQLKAMAEMIKIEIGPDEDAASRRRNKSAHGIPIPEGKELEAIRDMKLLMVLFHRMLLAITGAAEFYLDYASSGIPMRHLKEPVLSTDPALDK
jgi:hypothetical protein